MRRFFFVRVTVMILVKDIRGQDQYGKCIFICKDRNKLQEPTRPHKLEVLSCKHTHKHTKPLKQVNVYKIFD